MPGSMAMQLHPNAIVLVYMFCKHGAAKVWGLAYS